MNQIRYAEAVTGIQEEENQILEIISDQIPFVIQKFAALIDLVLNKNIPNEHTSKNEKEVYAELYFITNSSAYRETCDAIFNPEQHKTSHHDRVFYRIWSAVRAHIMKQRSTEFTTTADENANPTGM